MTFSERLWKAILKSWGGAITLISFVASIAVYFVVPNTATVKMNIFFVIVMILAALIIVLFRAAYDANTDASVILPKVRRVLNPPKSYEKASVLLIVDPSNYLSHESSVTLFMLEDDYEQLIGVGVVINVQNDKKVQVAIYKNDESEELLSQLKENKKHDLERLILKPSVPRAFLEGDL
ncbi:hypothetical protein [Plesiomonas sp. PI-19]|uniref:hypothetical protein n=1 Tax=Plesiomonas sp. PI-19 TaxID=2898798 RepID=UPI001F3BE57E|nr:hypothetical protein [Plesiomonas sp. PI-19]MCE5163754.1 hypothetical protein [Plesiomonas sp. PI-19]